tara:strand:- start:660 stop:905 length:246 start_codon:yes stop_codon:yes gene_type:complete
MPKVIGWVQSDERLADWSKFAIPAKTIRAVTLDKSGVEFKVFVADKAGTTDFLSVKNLAIKPTHDECVESGQLWDLSEVGL